MLTILLLILAVYQNQLSFFTSGVSTGNKAMLAETNQQTHRSPIVINGQFDSVSLNDIVALLQNQANTLNQEVIEKVITTLSCAHEYKIEHNHILTIIDYSLPSNQKRLWVFDLKEKRLLFHTYVSHGIKSGTLLTDYFSNKYDSKASSIGVYKTDKSYYGREGLSLRLNGLDVSFNDNATNRSVVMHGGWYVNEQFIKKYGRPGRSWGCPAVPPELSKSIINTIKDNSFFVIYYPSDQWFSKSKFLHCNTIISNEATHQNITKNELLLPSNEKREEILFADLHNKNRWVENNPVVVISADNYERIFHKTAPVGRMLRRQINQSEYIALSNSEFSQLVSQANENSKEILNTIYFVVPEIVMVRGYYETLMKLVNLGKIKEVRTDNKASKKSGDVKQYSIYFDSRSPITLKPTGQFIRWVGL